MSKRIATILAPKDLGAAGTEVIDINLIEVISRITVIWKCTNVTVSVMLDAVTACISKIELVDGSSVIFSASGAEIQALNFSDHKVMPYHKISLTVGGFFEAAFHLDFGRFLYDTMFALDPGQFKNLQLKITWDEDACNTSVVVNTCQVYAHVDDGARNQPIGYFAAREIKQYAMAGSSWVYSDLPTDVVIRKVLIRALSTDHDPIALLDTIKISADNDKLVLMDMKADDYARMLSAMYPRVNEMYTLDAVVTAKTLYSALSRGQQISISYDATAFVTAQSKFAVATWTGQKCALTASVDIQADNAEVSGELPGNGIPISFGDDNDPDTWLNAMDYGSVKVDLLDTSDADSGDTIFLVAQQVKKY